MGSVQGVNGSIEGADGQCAERQWQCWREPKGSVQEDNAGG